MRTNAKALLTFIAVATIAATVAAPAAAARSRPPRDLVVFVSRADLIAAGQLVDHAPAGPQPVQQAGCLWNCDHVRAVRYVGLNKPFVTSVRGNGPQTLGMDISLGTQNGYTATIGIAAPPVTAGVGFNVSWSGTVTYTTSTSVPAGACYTITAQNVFRDYTFEIWREPFFGSDYRVGTGRAWAFAGVQYTVTFSC